jgi:DNA-binding response OmpR family regulator
MLARGWVMEKNKGRILCVDNDQDTCDMITLLLGQAGYEVIQAMNIAEGLTLARRERFDLILLDWFFGDGTGLELCQMIRAFDSQTVILFYSGAVEKDEIKQAISAGAQGFLVKPIGIDDLVQNVSRLVNRDSGVGPRAD